MKNLWPKTANNWWVTGTDYRRNLHDNRWCLLFCHLLKGEVLLRSTSVVQPTKWQTYCSPHIFTTMYTTPSLFLKTHQWWNNLKILLLFLFCIHSVGGYWSIHIPILVIKSSVNEKWQWNYSIFSHSIFNVTVLRTYLIFHHVYIV